MASGMAHSKAQCSDPEHLSLSEVRGDLFTCPSKTSLAHCVSEDLRMGKGIATLFKAKFGRVSELKAQDAGVGSVATLSCDERYIYYLITKRKYYDKPTYESLTNSLKAMKDHIVSHGITQLAIPRIGCGLDQLSWNKVLEIIKTVFHDVPINITVYYL